MKQLQHTAPEVYQGFLNGDFVVKEINRTFNQVPDDQALEHINKLAKVSGGLVGISQNDEARSRWGLSFIFRTSLDKQTHEMFGMVLEDSDYALPTDCGPSRMKRDWQDMISIRGTLQRFNVFKTLPENDLVCLSKGDVVRDDIKIQNSTSRSNEQA